VHLAEDGACSKLLDSKNNSLGKPKAPQQRYFTEGQLQKIIEGTPGQYRVLFALLAGNGIRTLIGNLNTGV
jgi:hypothetical protein